MAFSIDHNPSADRFETRVSGQLCVLDYSLDGDVMTVMHTGVPAAIGGRRIASALTRAALTKARSEGWKVIPACSYVAGWMGKHPEFNDLKV